MGRRPLPIGTYGAIKAIQVRPKIWEARATFRHMDGTTSRPARRGRSKSASENALRTALSEMATVTSAGDISRDTKFPVVAALWYAEIEREASLEMLSTTTVRLYRGYLDNHVLPALKALSMGELKVRHFDKVVKDTHDKLSYDAAKSVRAVLSGICGYAVRHGVYDTNPVRSVARLARGQGEGKEVVALSAIERIDMLDKLERYAESRQTDSKGRRVGKRVVVWHDLADLQRASLATGGRLGEILAVTGEDVCRDKDGRLTVHLGAHIVRVTGRGLVRKSGRKGGKPGLLLIVPEWSAPMWLRRQSTSGAGPLFPSASGQWLDPSNTATRLGTAMDACGYGWVTSHVWRKTVATVLDEAGLAIGEIADQLGNTRAIVEKHYIKKRPTNERAAAALESVLPPEQIVT